MRINLSQLSQPILVLVNTTDNLPSPPSPLHHFPLLPACLLSSAPSIQTLSTVINLRVPWPAVLTLILEALSSMSGSFGDSVNAVECLYADQSHADFYLGALIAVAVLPFLFIALLAVYWFCGATRSSTMGCGQTVTRGPSKAVQGTRAGTGSDSIRGRSNSVVAHEKFKVTATDALIMSSVLFWFMILPSVLRMSFVSFECKTVLDGEGEQGLWLLLDLEQRCGEGKHLAMLLVSLGMVALHAVVVPTAVVIILYRAGEYARNSAPKLMFRYGLIHSGYRKEKYWWEIVVLCRKICIILISTFAASDQMQLHFSLAVLIISLHAHDTNRPFGSGDEMYQPPSHGVKETNEKEAERLERNDHERSLHKYEMGSLLCLLFLIWSGMFFYYDLCSTNIISCSILIIAVLASNGGYLLMLATRCLKEWGKRNKLKTKLENIAHTLHLDAASFRLAQHYHTKGEEKQEKEKGNDDEKLVEMIGNPLSSKGEKESVIDVITL